MFELLYPKQHLNSIFELDPDELRSLGIKGIIADMDNTLVPWNDRTVQPRLARWLQGLREEGFHLCIVSNNTADRGGGVGPGAGYTGLLVRSQTPPPRFPESLA